MTPPPDNRVAALREEIRRAGSSTGDLRRFLRGSVVAVFFLSMVCVPTMLESIWYQILLTGFYWLVLAPPVVVLYRWLRTRQLRRRLRAVPSERLADLLTPLSAEPRPSGVPSCEKSGS